MKSEIFIEQLDLRITQIKDLVKRSNKMPLMVLTQHPIEEEDELRLPYVRECFSNILCFVEVGDTAMLPVIFDKMQDVVDKVVLDIDNKRPNSQEIIRFVQTYRQPLQVLTYSDLDMWSNAALEFIEYIEKSMERKRVLLLGQSYLMPRLLMGLLKKGALVHVRACDFADGVLLLDRDNSIRLDSPNCLVLPDIDSEQQYDVIVGCELLSPIKNLPTTVFAEHTYDIGLYNFSQQFIATQKQHGGIVYRFDNRAGMSGVILRLMETMDLVEHIMGEVTIGDISVVSGGQLGADGAIVVDNCYNPSMVLGVANGCGMFKSDEELTSEDKEHLQKIHKLINH